MKDVNKIKNILIENFIEIYEKKYSKIIKEKINNTNIIFYETKNQNNISNTKITQDNFLDILKNFNPANSSFKTQKEISDELETKTLEILKAKKINPETDKEFFNKQHFDELAKNNQTCFSPFIVSNNKKLDFVFLHNDLDNKDFNVDCKLIHEFVHVVESSIKDNTLTCGFEQDLNKRDEGITWFNEYRTEKLAEEITKHIYNKNQELIIPLENQSEYNSTAVSYNNLKITGIDEFYNRFSEELKTSAIKNILPKFLNNNEFETICSNLKDIYPKITKFAMIGMALDENRPVSPEAKEFFDLIQNQTTEIKVLLQSIIQKEKPYTKAEQDFIDIYNGLHPENNQPNNSYTPSQEDSKKQKTKQRSLDQSNQNTFENTLER